MARLTGNQFWRLRTKHGRDKIFGDAAVLLAEAHAYFDWCDRHPWNKVELVKYQGDSVEAEVPLGRPYTVDGLMSYLGVSGGYFRAAKRHLREKIEKQKETPADLEILDAIEMIEQTIRTQQIEGAAVGVFSANLVARINGLADNTNVSSSGEAVLRVTVRDAETGDNMNRLEETL